MVTSTVVDTYLVENRTKLKFGSFGELDWNRDRVDLNIEAVCFIEASCRGATLRNLRNNILQNLAIFWIPKEKERKRKGEKGNFAALNRILSTTMMKAVSYQGGRSTS